MSESYFFALFPRYLKVEHGFAKNIRPNTKYRLVIYKGIQKCDQMKEGVKSKLFGGRIDLQSPELSFNVPHYNPTTNVQFTVKLYEEKPNEGQMQIASYVIMSSEYIKTYKNDNQTFFPIEGQLQAELSLGLQLFVEKSKFSLRNAIKKITPPQQKINKQIPAQNKSESSRSRQLIRQGDGFISPRKRFERISSPPKSHQPVQKAITIETTPISRSKIASPQSQIKTAQVVSDSTFKQVVRSPRNQKITSNLDDFQVKDTPHIFDIVRKEKNVTGPKEESQEQQAPQKDQESLGLSRSKLGTSNETPPSLQQSKIQITMQDSAKLYLNTHVDDDRSLKKDLVIKVKPAQNQRDQIHQSAVLKGSSRLGQVIHQNQHQQEIKNAQRTYQERRNQIIYVIFLIVSAFLIYTSMIPTRRV